MSPHFASYCGACVHAHIQAYSVRMSLSVYVELGPTFHLVFEARSLVSAGTPGLQLVGPQASCAIFMSPGIMPLGITEPATAFDSWGSRDSNSGHQVCTRSSFMDPAILLDPNCSVNLNFCESIGKHYNFSVTYL